ncbi:MAG: SCO family protein [Alphaproteobacteria bacterium]|nr:SCO family protein [Alphaproteobacteria bacterium]MDE2042032.1 SCO family protein [Alphaproteobacteria bacterium]MDE2340974.1 SCO family protein [Alphaproteobacteria bacterium]
MLNCPHVPVLALLMALIVPLAGCKLAPQGQPISWIRQAHIGGPFNLIDQDGQPVSDTSLQGKYRIIYFGYTFCPDACPTDMQQLMSGFRIFERAHPDKATKVQPIFITVDPARDNPAHLKAFVRAFHPRLMGLTGTPAQIAAVAKEYAAVYQAQKPGPNGKYLVDHSRTAVLYGPQGAPLILLSIGTVGTPQRIADELAAGVR